MIYTTYFAKLRSLPDDITPISICAWPPSFYKGLQYKLLAPPAELLRDFKETGNTEEYIRRYNAAVLAKLDPAETVTRLQNLTGKPGDVALICYEKSGDFCHRNLVAAWLRSAGIPCEEWGAVPAISMFSEQTD